MIECRQPDDELAAAVGAFATGLHGTTVELNQPAHKREPDAEAALRAIERVVNLSKKLEDGCEFLSGYTNAVIAYAENGLGPRAQPAPDQSCRRARYTWRHC